MFCSNLGLLGLDLGHRDVDMRMGCSGGFLCAQWTTRKIIRIIKLIREVSVVDEAAVALHGISESFDCC